MFDKWGGIIRELSDALNKQCICVVRSAGLPQALCASKVPFKQLGKPLSNRSPPINRRGPVTACLCQASEFHRRKRLIWKPVGSGEGYRFRLVKSP